MSDIHPIADTEAPAIVAPANARDLFLTLAAEHAAKIAAEVRELQTVHALCLAFNTVDEDAFGEAAEQLTYHGAQGTPPSPNTSVSKSPPCSGSAPEPEPS